MKASTVTFLAIIFVSVLLIGAIPITLKYKLKNQLYTQLSPADNYRYDRYSYGKANKILISNIANCTIIPSDSLYIEIERLDDDVVKVFMSGDTLAIGSVDREKKVLQKIRIFVPGVERIICRNSNVLLRGSIKVIGIHSFLIDLANSKLSTAAISDEWRAFQFLDQLEINGTDSASVDLSGSIRIYNLILNDVSSVSGGPYAKVDNMKVLYTGKDTVKSKSNSGRLEIQGF